VRVLDAGVALARDRRGRTRVEAARVVGEHHRHGLVVLQLRRAVGLDELHEIELGHELDLRRRETHAEGADRIDVLHHLEAERLELALLPAVGHPGLRQARGIVDARHAVRAALLERADGAPGRIRTQVGIEHADVALGELTGAQASERLPHRAGALSARMRGTPTQRTKSSAATRDDACRRRARPSACSAGGTRARAPRASAARRRAPA
jgi:hypothetical protein